MRPDEFWEQNDTKCDQKFYTAFCILVAACSDYAIGETLRLQKQLNWACTTFYYSLVHAARLMCFIENGNFPTSHLALAKLFKGEQNCGGGRTWVGQNHSYFAQQVEPNNNFQVTLISLEERNRLGVLLDKARSLRNDANYEGLLISHEYSHAQVTQSFQRLAESLKDASEEVLPKMIGIFKGFVDKSSRREYWYAFLNWQSGHGGGWGVPGQQGEGLYYLEASLRYRSVSDRTILTIKDWLSGLYCQPDVDTKLAGKVHGNIVMSVFKTKNSLMKDFKDEIDDFESFLKKGIERRESNSD